MPWIRLLASCASSLSSVCSRTKFCSRLGSAFSIGAGVLAEREQTGSVCLRAFLTACAGKFLSRAMVAEEPGWLGLGQRKPGGRTGADWSSPSFLFIASLDEGGRFKLSSQITDFQLKST